MPTTLELIEAETELTSVIFTLNGTPEVRTFREDRSIVVDIGLDGAKAKQAEEGAAAKQVPATTPKISLPESTPSKSPTTEIQPKAAAPKTEPSASAIAAPASIAGAPAKEAGQTQPASTIS